MEEWETIVKKVTALVVLVIIGVFTSASGFDFDGRIAIGGFVDYSFGMGSNFDDVVVEDTTLETSLGFSFGGELIYGITSSIALAARFDYVMVNFNYSGMGSADLIDPKNENIIALNINGMYFFGTDARIIPFVEAGPGFYIPSKDGADSKFGLNAGAGFLYFFQEDIAFEFGGRYHLIFDCDDELDKDKTTYIDFHAGLNFFLGGM
jgi:Outer membrane protein beta-barrel domain